MITELHISKFFLSAGLLLQLVPVTVYAELPVSRQNELLHMIRHDCGSCHGMTLKGGLGLPLTAERLAQRPAGELADIIRNGVNGTPMPAWDELLDDEEITWMVKQLQQGIPDEHTD